MRALLGLPLIDKAAVIAACETPPDRLTARARPSTHDYAAISFYTGGRARIEQNGEWSVTEGDLLCEWRCSVERSALYVASLAVLPAEAC